ncbi:MAG: rubrerythrin family protein [Victivallales bacterium]|nr:rubrerythrin family protein [Victivallales bacterium]
MQKSIKGTRTETNLMAAFAGESQARNRYTYFAAKAKKDGFVQISKIFEETSDQEKEHAKRLFKFMEGGDTEITGSFPSGVIGDTADNLVAAAAGEHHEWESMYPAFADVADSEGFTAIASVFRAISVAEKQHEKRYLELAGNIRDNKVFVKDQPVTWRCMNCGYLHHGAEAPKLCPACAHPRDHFELLAENW